MLPGYNHNIKYRERVFHVQTEDSGVGNPHVITHLFEGGNILASVKTSYQELIPAADFSQKLRAVMQSQHKDMLRKLIAGELDSRLGFQPRAKDEPPSKMPQVELVSPDSGGLFEGLISEKSLDEVILAFLAQNTNPGDEKKG